MSSVVVEASCSIAYVMVSCFLSACPMAKPYSAKEESVAWDGSVV